MYRAMVVATTLFTAVLGTIAQIVADPQENQAMFENLPNPPRLFLLRHEEDELRRRIQSDPQLNAVYQLVLRGSDDILQLPLLERVVTGRRLLAVSRQLLRRTTHLGLAYRLTGDRKYALRAREEMLTVAKFSDWNPSHYLDVAEMTAGMAIGLDWCYDALDEQTRATLRQAIITLGLEPSLKHDHWSTWRNNWNQVCNAGMVLGALMVAEQQPELAGRMIKRAIDTVPISMEEYAPDGAYPEGAMYWDYGTNFNVLLISALQKALGDDFGLLSKPGLDRTADYFVHVKGPTGLWFNYSDCHQARKFSLSPAMHFLAAWQNRPGLLFWERKSLEMLVQDPAIARPRSTDRLLPLLLIWTRPEQSQGQPSANYFVGHGPTPVALFRSAWDESATFLGIKAGRAAISHGHIDAGSFVIDMLGTRFAEDLEMQDYHSLESVGVNMWDSSPDGDRWKVFRIGASAHNIITVNGADPVITGRSEIVASTDHSARIDLSDVYRGQLSSVTRDASLNQDGSVTIADEVVATEAGGVVQWALVTRATPELLPDGALLTRDGKSVRLKVTSSRPVEMKILAKDPRPADYDAPNEGVTIVGFQQRLSADEKANWRIDFIPQK